MKQFSIRQLALVVGLTAVTATLVQVPNTAEAWPKIKIKKGTIVIDKLKIPVEPRHVIKSVEQNAKGLDRSIKRNAATIAHVGRIQACWATLCVSEAYRQYKIDEAKKKAKAELENYRRTVLADVRNKSRAEQEAIFKNMVVLLESNLAIANEGLALHVAHESILSDLLNAFNYELEYRRQLAQNKLPMEASNQRFKATTQQFEAEIMKGADGSFDRFAAAVAAQAQASGLPYEAVLTEMIALFSEPVLANVRASIAALLSESQTKSVAVKVSIAAMKAELEATNKSLAEVNPAVVR